MNLNTMFTIYNNLFLTTNHYKTDNSLYIGIWSADEGPIANLTVCLDDKTLKANEAYIDTNNLPEAMRFIERYKLGKQIGFKTSGFRFYPLVAFDMEEVKKYEEG